MRYIVIVMVIVSAFGMTASAGLGGTEDRGKQDKCAENNAKVPGSCVQLPPGAAGDQSPVVVYIDTGRADGRAGMWQENNLWSGLQKTPFYGEGSDEVAPDLELL